MSILSHQKKTIPKLLTFFLITSILNGCVDLSGSRSTYLRNKPSNPSTLSKKTQNKQAAPFVGEVHTMRGGLGIFSIGMNQLRDSVTAQFKVPAYSTMWYNAGDVSRFIINNYYQQEHPRPIILIGHSLGANEQIKVARNLNEAGVPVALLVTVDAVSQTIVPPNVKAALNVYKPGYVPMFSGLKLRAVNPEKTRIDNINASTLPGVGVNHFTIDKDNVVQKMVLERIKKVLVDGKRKSA